LSRESGPTARNHGAAHRGLAGSNRSSIKRLARSGRRPTGDGGTRRSGRSGTRTLLRSKPLRRIGARHRLPRAWLTYRDSRHGRSGSDRRARNQSRSGRPSSGRSLWSRRSRNCRGRGSRRRGPRRNHVRGRNNLRRRKRSGGRLCRWRDLRWRGSARPGRRRRGRYTWGRWRSFRLDGSSGRARRPNCTLRRNRAYVRRKWLMRADSGRRRRRLTSGRPRHDGYGTRRNRNPARGWIRTGPCQRRMQGDAAAEWRTERLKLGTVRLGG